MSSYNKKYGFVTAQSKGLLNLLKPPLELELWCQLWVCPTISGPGTPRAKVTTHDGTTAGAFWLYQRKVCQLCAITDNCSKRNSGPTSSVPTLTLVEQAAKQDGHYDEERCCKIKSRTAFYLHWHRLTQI